MLAIALVLDGRSREDAAESCGMDRQTLRGWVRRHNAEGSAGLPNRRAPGPRNSTVNRRVHGRLAASPDF